MADTTEWQGQECDLCPNIMQSDAIWDPNEKVWICSECADTCEVCHGLCGDYEICSFCFDRLCEDCVIYCHECREEVCTNHATEIGGVLYGDCCTMPCYRCSKLATELTECSFCGFDVCAQCSITCIDCSKELCEAHLAYTSCDRCNECFEKRGQSAK